MAKINALSNASGDLTINSASGSDSAIQFAISTTDKFKIGSDNTDSFLKISQGSSLGTNDAFILTTNGESTKPLQPSFLESFSDFVNVVTGDGTVWTVTWSVEHFDQTNDFDGTSTFTAPVTGRYRIKTGVLLSNCYSYHTGSYLAISTSNREYRSFIVNPFNVGVGTSLRQCSMYMSALVDMDASDTVVIKAMVSGTNKYVHIGYPNRGFFGGNLIC